MNLIDLACKYKTDKGVRAFDLATHMHGYVKFYQQVFEPIREQRLNILDIGACGANQGGSSLMWEEYFPNATVVAMDSNPLVLNIASAKIIKIQQDLDDESGLIAVLTRLGLSFNIIIEDASHLPRQQMRTLVNTSCAWDRQCFHYFTEDLGPGTVWK